MLKHDLTSEEIALGLQEETQVWECLLYTTGGALELSKCFYYIIAYDFHKNGAPVLLAPEDMPGIQILLTSGSDPAPIIINQKDANTAHVTLVVRPDPSSSTGNQSDF
jgi:hypothetical protein